MCLEADDFARPFEQLPPALPFFGTHPDIEAAGQRRPTDDFSLVEAEVFGEAAARLHHYAITQAGQGDRVRRHVENGRELRFRLAQGNADPLLLGQRSLQFNRAGTHPLLEHDRRLEQGEVRTLHFRAAFGAVHQRLDDLVEANDLRPRFAFAGADRQLSHGLPPAPCRWRCR